MAENIERLKIELKNLESHLFQIESDFMEQLHLYRADQLCDTLKCAIINQTLCYPETIEFERVLSKIQSNKDFLFIVERLRRIKMLTNPTLMHDKQLKTSASTDAILTAALTQFSDGAVLTNADFDKVQMTPLLLQHFNRLKLSFDPYLNELSRIVHQLASARQIIIDGDFTIVANSFPTSCSRDKLVMIFDMLVEEKYIEGGSTEKATFLSMFESTVTASENQITVIKVGKSKKPSISWLHVMFTELLGKNELSNEEKAIIAKFFTLPNEQLKPDSIKPRKESVASREFRSKLAEILK